MNEITLDEIIFIADRNVFPLVNHAGKIPPTVVVFRNMLLMGGQYGHVADEGDNLTDTVCLIDDDGVTPLKGRSYPHKKYQAQQADGSGAANYIASGYYPRAWVRGLHRGMPAAVQNQAFTIWRSRDMDLHENDDTPDDDFHQTGIVADNFHGLAPYSAGCVTVFGKMNPPTHDWAVAHEWLYDRHKNAPYYGAMVLHNDDFAYNLSALRIGSLGDPVIRLQTLLKMAGFTKEKPDGSFGPGTFAAVINFQRQTGLRDSGIMYAEQMEKLETLAGSR